MEEKVQIDYIKRINKVFQFIDENLDSDLSLHVVSDIAHFSPFHFHRIFKTISGETLNEYITRKRLEKAAATLIHKNDVSITELSLQNGFNNNSSFTRTFKKFYGVSPREFRQQNRNTISKIGQFKSKNGQEYPDNEKYLCVINNLKNWIDMNAKIEVKEMPAFELAYVSCLGEQNIAGAYEKLIKWATPKELLKNKEAKMITIYHDSFKITEPAKVRMSACLVLKGDTDVSGEVGRTSTESGKFIVGSFEIGLHDFEKSWTGLFLWMNQNGYKKADKNPFEIYYNDFREHPEKKCIVDFCIPIE